MISDSLSQSAKIDLAAKAITSGGIVAYPTEAVYGLGCDPFQAEAVDKIHKLKQRSPAAGFILLAANIEMLASIVDFAAIPPQIYAKMLASWPGPVTWCCPRLPGLPENVCGQHPSIAVRVSAHPLAAALSSAVGGPIISTSANLAGQLPLVQAIDVRRVFDDAIDYILDGSVGSARKPTQIRDALTDDVIRSI